MYHETVASQEHVKNLFYRVYAWMTGALLVTAATSYAVIMTPSLVYTLWSNTWLIVSLIAVQLIVVIVFSSKLPTLSYRTALSLFLAYVILSGVTLSAVLLVYPIITILRALIVTGGMFASAAVYGYFTDTDLSKMRSLLTMALFGFIIALLANLFLQSTLFDFIISCVGVVLFTVLTAFDVNAIKRYADQIEEGTEDYNKVALLGALKLYLDFVNLFLNILRLMGGGRKK